MATHIRHPGFVVLDAGCYQHLRDPTLRERMVSDLRLADLEIRPSTLNLLEIAKHPIVGKRKDLLRVMGTLRADGPLLPWPSDLLATVGRSMLKGEGQFRIEYTGFEWITEEPFDIADEHLAKARRFMSGLEQVFDQTHLDGRKVVQKFLKERGLRGTWADAGSFLDDQWSRPEQLDTLIEGIWKQLKLPGTPSVAQVLENRAFQLLFDGLGIAVYERAVTTQQPGQVQHSDLLQLVYLAGAPKGVILTKDGNFYRAASAILNTRYPNLHAMKWSEYVRRFDAT